MELLGFSDPQHFGLIWQQSPVSLAKIGIDGSIIATNASLSELLGYAQVELEHMKFQDFTDPRDISADAEQMRRILTKELGSYSMVKRFITKQGKTVWIKLHVAPVFNTSGIVDHLIATVLELPNHGNYKVESFEQDVIVRPSLTVGQFVADNWQWFMGAGTGLLFITAPIVWKLALFVDALQKKTGISW